MEQEALLNELLQEVNLLLNQGLDNASIEKQLLEKGHDAHLITKLIAHAKRVRNAARTRSGSILVLIGVIILGLGFISCVIVHNSGDPIGIPLYGLTTLGLLIVFAGLIMIFQ